MQTFKLIIRKSNDSAMVKYKKKKQYTKPKHSISNTAKTRYDQCLYVLQKSRQILLHMWHRSWFLIKEILKYVGNPFIWQMEYVFFKNFHCYVITVAFCDSCINIILLKKFLKLYLLDKSFIMFVQLLNK